MSASGSTLNHHKPFAATTPTPVPVINGTVTLCRARIADKEATSADRVFVSMLGVYQGVALTSLLGRTLTPEVIRQTIDLACKEILQIEELKGMRVVKYDLAVGPPWECTDWDLRRFALDLPTLRADLRRNESLANLGPKFRDRKAARGIREKIRKGETHLAVCKACAATAEANASAICRLRPMIAGPINHFFNLLNQATERIAPS